ncbi:hypothetical protein LTR17_014277 [Elasticomyces elasticus]|nr:hypothetical protein LTR17_014277 [Elasticomyces elasticus]
MDSRRPQKDYVGVRKNIPNVMDRNDPQRTVQMLLERVEELENYAEDCKHEVHELKADNTQLAQDVEAGKIALNVITAKNEQLSRGVSVFANSVNRELVELKMKNELLSQAVEAAHNEMNELKATNDELSTRIRLLGNFLTNEVVVLKTKNELLSARVFLLEDSVRREWQLVYRGGQLGIRRAWLASIDLWECVCQGGEAVCTVDCAVVWLIDCECSDARLAPYGSAAA